jgi:hypothetical protein
VKESIRRKNRQTATKSISTQNWESTVEFERLSRGVFCIDFVKKAASKQASKLHNQCHRFGICPHESISKIETQMHCSRIWREIDSLWTQKNKSPIRICEEAANKQTAPHFSR